MALSQEPVAHGQRPATATNTYKTLQKGGTFDSGEACSPGCRVGGLEGELTS